MTLMKLNVTRTSYRHETHIGLSNQNTKTVKMKRAAKNSNEQTNPSI